MYRYLIFLIAAPAMAHQFTPTYPKFAPSFIEGVDVAKMELFNSRKDVDYYEIGVFGGDWKPVVFASEAKLIPIKYLEKRQINVYLRHKDVKSAVYICTTSRLLQGSANRAGVASRICSKVR